MSFEPNVRRNDHAVFEDNTLKETTTEQLARAINLPTIQTQICAKIANAMGKAFTNKDATRLRRLATAITQSDGHAYQALLDLNDATDADTIRKIRAAYIDETGNNNSAENPIASDCDELDQYAQALLGSMEQKEIAC